MEYYKCVVIMVSIIGIYSSFNVYEVKRNRFSFILIFIVLGSLLAFRDQFVGVDTGRYYLTYTSTKSMNFEQVVSIREGANIGYFLLNAVCSKIGMSFQLFVSILSIWIVFSTLFVYKKTYSLDIFAIFGYLGLGVYTFCFSGLKQAISMSFIIWSVYFLWKAKAWYAYVMFVAAFLFHPVAIVFLPFLFLRKITFSYMHIIMIVVGFLILFLFRYQIAYFITLMFAENYIGHYESKETVGGSFIFLIINTLFFVFLFKDKVKENNTVEKDIFLMLIIASALQLLSSYAYAFTRVNLFYMQFVPIALSMMFRYEHSTVKRMIIFSLLIADCYMCYNLFYGHIIGEQLEEYSLLKNF